VLKDFSLVVHRGENLVVLGKSGSGKSVLIKCIIGLLQVDEGTITVLGQDVGALDYADLDRLRAKLGFLFQSNALYDSMTVNENLLFPLRRQWLTHTPAEEKDLVQQALEDVGLADTAEKLPAELSGGQRKRIALARTIISHDMACVRLTADRVAVLIDGRCYAEGTYEELQRNEDPKIHEFFV